MIFKYEATDRSGTDIKDTIEAKTSDDAISKIRAMGYFVTSIRTEGESGSPSRGSCHVSEATEIPPMLRLAVTFGPVVLLAVCFSCLWIPLSYGWNHDELNTLQVIKANWKSSLAGVAIFCLLSVWVRLRKWAEGGS